MMAALASWAKEDDALVGGVVLNVGYWHGCWFRDRGVRVKAGGVEVGNGRDRRRWMRG
jgi:hypothetical protein